MANAPDGRVAPLIDVYWGSSIIPDKGFMKRSANPYTPGAGKRPAKLAGRDPDLENFSLLLERLSDGRHERSMIFSGLRGIGKTVLLLEFDILAGEAEWFSTAVQEVGVSADFRTSMGRSALRLLRSMSLRQRMKDRAKAALSVVKSFSIAGPGGIKLQLDVDAAPGSADTGDIEQDLADLLVEIGEVARAGGTGALFLIDEMQNLDKASLGAICMALHRVSQRDLPVALAGAGLPTLPMMLRAAKPYAPRLFSYHTLGRLSDAEARLALVGPAVLQGVEFEGPAIDLVVEQAGGYPYFLQEYGRVLWDEVDTPPITVTSVRGVEEIVEDNLDRGFFGPAFDLATDAEQRYLIAIASLGDGPYRTVDAARAAGYASIGGASVVREELIEKELLWSPRRGQIDFTVPRFAAYLRAAHGQRS